MSTSSNGRAKAGHFAPGNPGGPGRPRRAIEADYLRTITEACPPDTWRRICERAAVDAEAGDSKARDFLTRHLVGDLNPGALVRLAADDARDHDPVAEQVKEADSLDAIMSSLRH